MNNATNGQGRNQKRLRMMGSAVIMIVVLAVCMYFLPAHPIVVTAVILGFLLAIWREREAKLVFDLSISFWIWGLSTWIWGLSTWIWGLSTVCSMAMKIFKWPLQALRILPKNDD
jgi:hypothetical protein